MPDAYGPDTWPFGWVWQAIHRDGTVVNEYDQDGTGHAYSEIDHKKLVAMHLWPVREGLPHFMVEVPKGASLVYCRRRGHHVLTGEPIPPWHLLGYKRRRWGQDEYSVTFINEAGDSFLSSDFDAIP